MGLLTPDHTRSQIGEGIAERAVRRLHLADAVALRKPVRLDCDPHQIVSAKRGSKVRKTVRPPTKSNALTVPLTAACPQWGATSPSIAHRQPAMAVDIGFSENNHCHFVGISLIEYMTPETSGRICRKTGIMYGTSRHRTLIVASRKPIPSAVKRSEEHTSELQSRENLVCRL